MKVTNNIVAAATWTGFTAMGHECGDYSKKIFYNNIAHSIGGFGGHGALIYPDPTDKTQNGGGCMEGSHFIGYKLIKAGVYGGLNPGPQTVIFSNMKMIDNQYGMGASLTGPGKNGVVHINDNKIWGESELPDCPPNGGFCTSPMRGGFCMNTMGGEKPLHPIPPKRIPYDKPGADASWDGKFIFNNNELINFKALSRNGGTSRAFILHANSPDYMPAHSFLNTMFTDVEHDALASFADPSGGWANPKDCGNFPCTAPWNSFIDFRRAYFKGFSTVLAPPEFQIIPDNPGFSPYLEGCKF
jgi:hypothetical protein